MATPLAKTAVVGSRKAYVASHEAR